MATETPAEMANSTPGETPAAEAATTTPDATATPPAETATTGQAVSDTTQQEDRLPDDHPLVKAYTSSQEQLRALKGTHQTKVQELEAQVSQLTAKTASADEVQAKYDRLESFLTSLGGPISKALDSKSFSTALFESDTDIKELVAQWHRDNPSATSTALGSSAGSPAGPQPTMNEILRAASPK